MPASIRLTAVTLEFFAQGRQPAGWPTSAAEMFLSAPTATRVIFIRIFAGSFVRSEDR